MTGERTGHNLAPTTDELLEMASRMMLIRAAEERLGQDSNEGVLPGNVHLYVGQEAVATGVCHNLTCPASAPMAQI
jgi:acetoin:2,6-dichlorophenolindophenol oxidoreductase subunit alpha